MKMLSVPAGATAQMQLPKTVAELEKALELPDRNSRDRVIEWARQNPQQAASLIKGWIQEK
jgi:flagellar biosynthesis/type III secretory pathway M-ring protein FliF/YscJ